MATTRSERIAWAAGLFEGEGTIYLDPRGYPQLKLVMQDADIVERFADVVGVGLVRTYKPPSQAHYKRPMVTWACSARADVAKVLGMLIPHFGIRRRARAVEVAAACVKPDKRPSLRRQPVTERLR